MEMDATGPDFLRVFAEGLVDESKLAIAAEQRAKLVDALTGRIEMRLFLEMLALLTPEQADKVNKDIENEAGNPGATIQAIAREIPDFGVQVAAALLRIHGELSADLRSLVSAMGKPVAA